MDLSGPIGGSGVSYDVSVDGSLNIVLSVKVPLLPLLNKEVAVANSPILSSVVGVLEQAAQAYVASQAPKAP